MLTRKLLRWSLKSLSSPKHRRQSKRHIWPHTTVEVLEDRMLLSVDALSGFDGLDFAQTVDGAPPDTIAAAGPNDIVEMVNTDLAVYDKSSGNEVFHQDLRNVFSSLNPGTYLTDPVVAYDEDAGRFVIGVLDLNITIFGTVRSDRFLFAVSDSSDPTQDTNGDGKAFSEMHAIDMTGNTGVFADYPRIGWNADGYFATFNMFTTGFSNYYDHATVIAISKSSVTDHNSGTLDFTHTDRGFPHFTLAPATMHGSSSGDPMYFVEEALNSSGNSTGRIRVTAMHNAFSNPTFSDTQLAVANYTQPPAAAQKGSSSLIETNDTRILNAEWRGGTLVAAQTVGVGDGQAHARWYEIDTSGTPTLDEQGTIGIGSGASSYFPSIAIASGGDLGMTYIQSSSNEYMSMYVTGRSAGDPSGTMQTPVLAKAGETSLFATFDSSPYRAGDYSGITVDPLDNTFWAANEYAKTPTDSRANWGTWIEHFRLPTGPEDTTPPAAPTGLTVSSPNGTSGTLFLDWADNGESDLAGYRVYRDSGSGYQRIASLGKTSQYTDSGLVNGQTYSYQVTAVDTSGNESVPSSPPVSGTPADTQAPAAPQHLTGTSADTQITLNWSANTETDLAGYNIYRSGTSGGPYTLLMTVGTSASPTYTDTGLTNGNTYYYVVTAVDNAATPNESGYSNQASGTPGDTQPPAPPTGLSATSGDQQVTLAWTANTETDLTSYNVYRFNGSTYVKIASVPKSSNPGFIDTGLSNGTTYQYVVTALDTAGNESAQSSPVSATPRDGVAPSAPTGLTATVVSGHVSLDWNDNTESDLAGYNIYRGTVDGGPYAQIANLVTSSSYTDLTAAGGTTYYYVVRAADTSGNPSDFSNQVSATLPSGNANDIYVWDIAWSDKANYGGLYYTVTAIVTVKQDSNADGIAESDDANVRRATLSLRMDHYYLGTYLTSTTFQNVTTNRQGRVRLNLITFFPGDFAGTVISLSAGSQLSWQPNLDQDNPSYYAGVPGGHEVDQLPYFTSISVLGGLEGDGVVTSRRFAFEAPLGIADPPIASRFEYELPIVLDASPGGHDHHHRPGKADHGAKSHKTPFHPTAVDALFTHLSRDARLAEQLFDRFLV